MRATIVAPLFDVTVTRSGREEHVLHLGEPDSPAAEILGLSAALSRSGIDPLAVLSERLADEVRAMWRRLKEKSEASARAAELRRHVREETGNVNESLKELAPKWGTTPRALRKQIERAREVHPGDLGGVVIPKTKNPATAPIFALLEEAERRVADGIVPVTPEVAALWNAALAGFDRDEDGMVTFTPEVQARLVAAFAPYFARVGPKKSETSADVAETTPTLPREGGTRRYETQRRAAHEHDRGRGIRGPGGTDDASEEEPRRLASLRRCESESNPLQAERSGRVDRGASGEEHGRRTAPRAHRPRPRGVKRRPPP